MVESLKVRISTKRVYPAFRCQSEHTSNIVNYIVRGWAWMPSFVMAASA